MRFCGIIIPKPLCSFFIQGKKGAENDEIQDIIRNDGNTAQKYAISNIMTLCNTGVVNR